jgi:hypothetical protein
MVISLIPGLHGQESDGISRNSYCYCWSEIFEFLVIYLFIRQEDAGMVNILQYS